MKDDTISRAAAIEAVHNYWMSEGRKLPKKMVGEYEVLDWDYKSQLRHNKMICEAIKALPSAQPGWIPCTPETMPEKEGRYVCTYTYDGKKDVFMFRFEDGDFLVPWYVDTITAWYKPLDPWEGGSHE